MTRLMLEEGRIGDFVTHLQSQRKVYAPQHTHPHPAFSPDGRFVVFTSDRSGYSQVYEVEVT